MQITKTFADVGNSEYFLLKAGESLDYALTGTFTATLKLQYTDDGGQNWITFLSTTVVASGRIKNETKGDRVYRWSCTAYTSDDPAVLLATVYNTIQKLGNNAATRAKAGATAGWVVAAGDDVALVTCPQSKTASTLILPITGLKVGDVITAFSLQGQIESGGNAVTLDAQLRKHTEAAADVADAAVASMTQISVTADTLVGESNARKAQIEEVVGEDETFYLLITATTGASTDIALQGALIEIAPAGTY